MKILTIATSAQQAASSVVIIGSDLPQILLYIQARDRSVAEWVEYYRQAEHETLRLSKLSILQPSTTFYQRQQILVVLVTLSRVVTKLPPVTRAL